MNPGILFILPLFSIFFLASCTMLTTSSGYQKLGYKKIQKSDREYILSDIETCSNLYTNGELSVLEVFCLNDSDGLYIFGKNYRTKFDWYDKEFNLWAASENCNNQDSCFYELKVNSNGVVKEFKYSFWINLSEGFYKVKVLNKRLEVIEHQVLNQPS